MERFVSDQLVKLRSRYLKRGLVWLTLFLDAGLVYTLETSDDFWKLLIFFGHLITIFFTRNGDILPGLSLYNHQSPLSSWVSVSTFTKFHSLNESRSRNPPNSKVWMSLGLKSTKYHGLDESRSSGFPIQDSKISWLQDLSYS